MHDLCTHAKTVEFACACASCQDAQWDIYYEKLDNTHIYLIDWLQTRVHLQNKSSKCRYIIIYIYIKVNLKSFFSSYLPESILLIYQKKRNACHKLLIFDDVHCFMRVQIKTKKSDTLLFTTFNNFEQLKMYGLSKI